jgi:hypothetical protein
MLDAQLELLAHFLSRRDDIVERIQALLNAQRQPIEYLRDGALLSTLVEDCFFEATGVSRDHARLRGRLDAAHWANGFTPRALPGLHNGLIDPGEMMVRAFHLWQQTRWPGRNARLRYGHTLFNLYLIRCLELVSMRVWDDGPDGAGDRLARVQTVLDQLWKTSPADQPVLIRDARWLIPLAQSPATDDLGAYFEVAERIAHSCSEDDRTQIHTANVRLAAGHLRAQIRYYATKNGVPLDDPRVVLDTRGSNALDYALLVQDLAPLLASYEAACQQGTRERRRDLANTICQGISPDPELFLNRVELLAAYSMLEHLFITADPNGRAAYTPMGMRHARMLQEYSERIDRASTSLLEDAPQFRPVNGAYSPYGVLYGFSTDLIEHMAFATLLPGDSPRFGLEDVFVDGDARKRAWVNRWRNLPHLPPDVRRQFDYPQAFAEDIFGRIENALRQRAAGEPAPTGHLVIVPEDDPRAAAAYRAESYDEPQLLSDRREGRCLLSYTTATGWVAIRKTLLTDVLASGRDAYLAGLPASAVDALRLMYPSLCAPWSRGRAAGNITRSLHPREEIE